MQRRGHERDGSREEQLHHMQVHNDSSARHLCVLPALLINKWLLLSPDLPIRTQF